MGAGIIIGSLRNVVRTTRLGATPLLPQRSAVADRDVALAFFRQGCHLPVLAASLYIEFPTENDRQPFAADHPAPRSDFFGEFQMDRPRYRPLHIGELNDLQAGDTQKYSTIFFVG